MKAWDPCSIPLYDIERSYLENATEGPFFKGEVFVKDPGNEELIEFLGFKLRSRLGVPAGPLLNSRWIQVASQLGFDVLTYKTIRSFAYPGHPLPNMVFVAPYEAKHGKLCNKPQTLEELTVTNSFGMPSRSPEFIVEDIQKAKGCLREGQLLIVSVVGTPGREASLEEDFVLAAKLAQEGGAPVIEANFSCPNVGKKEGSLYAAPEEFFQIARRLVQEIAPIPLIIKVGTFASFETMRACFVAAARAGVRGICGINSVSMEVVKEDGSPALGKDRLTSGVCGSAIRGEALQWVRNASLIMNQEKLDLALLGCGGIVYPHHFDEFLEAGAHIAMSATGMMWDPYLAMRYLSTLRASI